MNSFTLNSKNSWADFGLIIEHRPTEEGGRKILEVFEIPGRTGTLVMDTGALSNVSRSYDVAFEDKTNLTEKMRKIRAWLYGASGYVRLTDTYDTAVYRLARVSNLGTFENVAQKYGRGTLSFDCDPRRFLTSGETAITAAGSINNPGEPARPRIELSAAGSGTLVIGGTTVTVTAATSSVIVDCEARTIEAGADKVSFPDFPVIPSGAGTISKTGGVTIVKILPRWWQP